MLLWDARDRLIDSLELQVVHDLGGLKARLHEVLPKETIEVASAQARWFCVARSAARQ